MSKYSHGDARNPAYPSGRARDRRTPPPREGAAACGGPSTPASRAAAIEAARRDNAARFSRWLANLAIATILALVGLAFVLYEVRR